MVSSSASPPSPSRPDRSRDLVDRLHTIALGERIDELRREATRLEASGQDGSRVLAELLRLQQVKRDIEGT